MSGSKENPKQGDQEEHYRHALLRHPQREQILGLLLDGGESSAAEIATALGKPERRVTYHLRVLCRRRAVKARARGPHEPPWFRWSPEAEWVRKLLERDDE